MEQDKNKGTDSSAGVKTPNPPQIMHPNSPKEREEKKAPAEKSDDKKQSGNSTPKKIDFYFNDYIPVAILI